MARRPYYRDYDDYDDRDRRAPQKAWYQQWYVWAILLVILGLIIISQLDLTKWGGEKTPGNETKQPTETEQMVSYILVQRAAGVADQEIVNKLALSGYSESKIANAFELADPVVQYILAELAKGTPRAQIIENLINQGIPPDVIAAKFKVVDNQKSNIGELLGKYWWVLLIGGVLLYYMYQNMQASKNELMPKVYTMEECRVYAEEILKQKNLDFSPTKEYRNRPEVKQYRYVFEEPLYPEFNTHRPWGYQAGQRQYYLLAVGYDKELLDFRITKADTDIRTFLYGNPKGYEGRSATEYMRLREQSEKPIPQEKKPEDQTDQERRGMIKRPYGRYSPGPIEGYES